MNKEAIERTKKLAYSFIISGIVGLIVLFVVICAALFSMQAKADIYIKIGSGYKLIETEYVKLDDGSRVDIATGGKISARIEIGKESGNWSYGLAHQSQWFAGFPFDKDEETEKSEIFIDYKWTL